MTGLLSVYANCSLGGVASVMRERVRVCSTQGLRSDFYFFRDFGGAPELLAAGAASVRIGRTSHENNVLTIAAEGGRVTSLFSHFGLGHALRREGLVVYAEVHGSHDAAISELEAAEGCFDAIVVPSEWSRRWLSSSGFDERLIRVVPNIVNRSVFFRGSALFGEAEGGQIPVVWVGRVEEHKNWRDALLTFSILKRRGVPVRPIMVMSLHSDRDRVAAVLQQASLVGVLDQLDLLYNISQGELANLLRAAAARGGCSLMTSRLESFGLAASESIACGLPVVAPAVGALPERVSNGANGFLFDFGDCERAASLIERVLTDDATRAEIREALQDVDGDMNEEAKRALMQLVAPALRPV